MATFNRTYSLRFTNVTLTAARTVFFINPTASGRGSAIELLSIRLSQSGSTTSAQERIEIYTEVSTWPTLVTSTPATLKSTDPASAITGNTTGAVGTCGVTASAEGGGAKTVLLDDAFNVLNGWLYVPVPEERIIINSLGTAAGLGLWFPAGPATVAGWSGTLTFAEL